jgi:hypothetical protein
VPKDGASVSGSRDSQGQTWPRSKTSVNNEAKPNTEKGPGEVASEQDRVLEEKAKTKTEAETSSRRPPTQMVLKVHQ